MGADHPFSTGPARRLPPGALPRIIAGTVLVAILALVAGAVISWARTPARVSGDGRSYGMDAADVTLQVQPDGSVDVREQLTFDFRGSFHGAYRDIPLRFNDEIDRVVVCDEFGGAASRAVANTLAPPSPDGATCPAGTYAYEGGGTTTLGSSDAPGRFGTERLDNPDGSSATIPEVERIVWHYTAQDMSRTFTIDYRARGWVRRVQGDDEVLVLEATPWGSEWGTALDELTVEVQLPSGASSVSRDDAVLAPRGSARTSDGRPLPAGIRFTGGDFTSYERADLLVLLPTDESGIDDPGALPFAKRTLPKLEADIASARDRSTTQTKLREQLHATSPWLLGIGAALAGVAVALVFIVIGWRRTLREDPWPDDVPRLLPDPPGALPPALAAALVEQRTSSTDTALVATVFDMVRRDAFKTTPAQGDEPGVQVDIALAATDDVLEDLQPWEEDVVELIDAIVGTDAIPMGEFDDVLRRSTTASDLASERTRLFRDHLDAAISQAGWLERASSRWLSWPRLVATLAFSASLFFAVLGPVGWLVGVDPRISQVIAALVLAGSGALIATITLFLSSHLVVQRYRPAARQAAARWIAYRDFLASYGDMQDEQTASIELWERHLVYAIAFGCADDILASVRPEGATSSPASAPLVAMRLDTIESLERGIGTRAPYDPPSSRSTIGSSMGRSSSFGSGSSSRGTRGGSGGGGGGGGGGGAW